jgi:hypothetical protein
MKTFKQLREGFADDLLAVAKTTNPRAKMADSPEKRKQATAVKLAHSKPAHSTPTPSKYPLGGRDEKSGRSYSEEVELDEANKHSVIGKIQRGHELKKKVDSSFKDIGVAQKAGDHAAGSKAFRKHERYANLERPGTWTKPVNEDGMGAGAVAAGPTNVTSSGAVAGMGQPPGSKSGEPGVDLRKKKRTTSDPRMFKQFRRKSPQA